MTLRWYSCGCFFCCSVASFQRFHVRLLTLVVSQTTQYNIWLPPFARPRRLKPLHLHDPPIVPLDAYIPTTYELASRPFSHPFDGHYSAHSTKVEYPLLRACSSSAALRAAGLHTHVRTHRTSSDPAYLIKSGLLVHFRKRGMSLFPKGHGLNKNHDPGSGLRPRNSGLKGPHTYAQPFLTSNGTWPTSLLLPSQLFCTLLHSPLPTVPCTHLCYCTVDLNISFPPAPACLSDFYLGSERPPPPSRRRRHHSSSSRSPTILHDNTFLRLTHRASDHPRLGSVIPFGRELVVRPSSSQHRHNRSE